MDDLDQHIQQILMTFSLSELLEQMDIDEAELLRYLIDNNMAKLPDFFNQMEDIEDGSLHMDDEDVS